MPAEIPPKLYGDLEHSGYALHEDALRALADGLLRIWQDGMRNKPMQWADFEREAVHLGLEVLALNRIPTEGTHDGD